MKLATNKNNFTVPGKNLNVSVAINLTRKELSAQGSSTQTASTGDKPAKVKISLQLALTERHKYRELLEIAKAKNSAGDPVVYEIVDEICYDHSIMQVIFTGKISCKKDNSLRCYNISFALQEFNSVAEKREKRETKKEIPVADIPGIVSDVKEIVQIAKEKFNKRF